MTSKKATNPIKFITDGIRDYSTVSVALLFSRILAGIITIITAKFLGSEKYAFFSAGFFTMSIIGFSTTGIDKTFVYYFIKNNSERRKDISTGFISLKIISYVSIIIISLIFTPYFKLLFGNLSKPIFWGIIISVSFFILSFKSAIFQAKQLFKPYSLINLIFYIIVLLWILIGIFVFRNSSIYYYLIAYIIGAIFIIPFRKPKEHVVSFNFLKAMKLLVFSKWLLLAELSWLSFIRLDYFIVSRILSSVDLGNYALALRLVNMFFVFVASMAVITLPKAAEINSIRQLNQFWKINSVISTILFVINIIILITAGKIILLIFGTQYLKSIVYFRLMLITYLPTIFFPSFQYILLTLKKERFYFLFYISLPVSYILLVKPLINFIGPNGVIMAKGISFIISLLIGIVAYHKNKKLIK